jgi:hypothetical protein
MVEGNAILIVGIIWVSINVMTLEILNRKWVSYTIDSFRVRKPLRGLVVLGASPQLLMQ